MLGALGIVYKSLGCQHMVKAILLARQLLLAVELPNLVSPRLLGETKTIASQSVVMHGTGQVMQVCLMYFSRSARTKA